MAKGAGGEEDAAATAAPVKAAVPVGNAVEDLPLAIVRRVVKNRLSQLCSVEGGGDEDVSVQKDALHALAEGARIFIHYLSATANDACKESKRQTISGEDVLTALEEIEFPEFIEPLKASLEEFRRNNAEKRSGAKAKAKDKKRKLDEELPTENGEDATDGVEEEMDKGNEDGAPVDDE